MKKIAIYLAGLFLVLSFSSFRAGDIGPKSGKIEIPAKGEFSMWKGVTHEGFRVKLNNTDPKLSVELYTVKSNGSEKWVSPSLLANSSLTIKIPANGHLFIKNFNPNNFTINYEIK